LDLHSKSSDRLITFGVLDYLLPESSSPIRFSFGAVFGHSILHLTSFFSFIFIFEISNFDTDLMSFWHFDICSVLFLVSSMNINLIEVISLN